MVVGNWNTKTFEKWWLEKLGLNTNHLTTEAIQCGNNYEHFILDALEISDLEKDKQIVIDRLRVNLDGNTSDCIYEVKTHKANKEFKVSKQYWRQVQVINVIILIGQNLFVFTNILFYFKEQETDEGKLKIYNIISQICQTIGFNQNVFTSKGNGSYTGGGYSYKLHTGLDFADSKFSVSVSNANVDVVVAGFMFRTKKNAVNDGIDGYIFNYVSNASQQYIQIFYAQNCYSTSGDAICG